MIGLWGIVTSNLSGFMTSLPVIIEITRLLKIDKPF